MCREVCEEVGVEGMLHLCRHVCLNAHDHQGAEYLALLLGPLVSSFRCMQCVHRLSG